jgi:hypothetical protein
MYGWREEGKIPMIDRMTADGHLWRQVRRGLLSALGLIALALPVSAQADQPAGPGHSGDNPAQAADWQSPPPWAPALGASAGGITGRKVG